MRKITVSRIMLSIIAGIGAGFFTATQFFNAWSASQIKGSALLAGCILICILMFLVLVSFTGKKSIHQLSPDLHTAMLIICAAIAGLIVLTVPLPQRLTPDRFQTLVIQPFSADAPILIEEVKINSTPLILADHLPPAGWSITPYGIESNSSSIVPFVVQKKGDLTRQVDILFGKGPAYGQASIRLGWVEQQIDLHLADRESETSVELASGTGQVPWNLIYILSIWFLLTSTIYVLLGMVLSKDALTRLAVYFIEKSASVSFWVIFTFLFWYGFAYVRSVFFDASHFMQNGNFLPAIRPIGNDLNLILKAGDSVADGGSPYVGANKYPPFATVLFVPLALMDKQAAFQLQTLLIYLSFVFVTLGFPLAFLKSRRLPGYAWFLFAAGLFSYGLSFEIERGQFNLTAIGCAFLAIFLFHRYPRLRWLSFILLTFAIQLKLYPAIFILFFMEDWRKWKPTLIIWGSIALVNMGLFFILGKDIGIAYLASLFKIVESRGLINWPGAHSILGFLSYYNNAWGLSDNVIKFIEKGLQAAVLLMVGYCFVRAYRRNRLMDPYLFLACTLAALTIPALSHDYTLSYLVGPVIFVLNHLDDYRSEYVENQRKIPVVNQIALIVLVTCFTGTFFSYMQKPALIQNQFPALFLMLICTILLAWSEPFVSGKNMRSD